MHIVFVCREYPPTLRGGGIASYIHEMAINLIRRAHSVTVICASDDTRVFSDRKEDGIRVIRLSGGDFILPQIEKSSLIKKMRCLYRFFSYRKKILRQIEQLKDVDITKWQNMVQKHIICQSAMYRLLSAFIHQLCLTGVILV